VAKKWGLPKRERVKDSVISIAKRYMILDDLELYVFLPDKCIQGIFTRQMFSRNPRYFYPTNVFKVSILSPKKCSLSSLQKFSFFQSFVD